MAELKPCPFCGSKKLKTERKSKRVGHAGADYMVEYHTFSVRCNMCHGRGGTVGGKVILGFYARYGYEFKYPDWATHDELLKQEAIEAWNRRAEDGKAD